MALVVAAISSLAGGVTNSVTCCSMTERLHRSISRPKLRHVAYALQPLEPADQLQREGANFMKAGRGL